MDLNFLGHEGQWSINKMSGNRKMQGDVWRDGQGVPKFALSSQKLRVLKEKYSMVVRNDIRRLEGENVDDATKNLFKILCGINNITIRQRGRNPLKDQVLIQYLDTVNFDVQDNDLIILNQLACIQKLAERRSFSLTNTQCSLIYHKFKNMFENRRFCKYQKQLENYKKGKGKAPKGLDIHELEENRQFRDTEYYQNNIDYDEYDYDEGRYTPQSKREWQQWVKDERERRGIHNVSSTKSKIG